MPLAGLGLEPVEQVVGLDADPLASRHQRRASPRAARGAGGLGLAFLGLDAGVDPELARRRRRERHHLVGEVHALARRLGVAERLEAGDHDLLQIALARVDHVDDATGAAERGRRCRVAAAAAAGAVSHTPSSSHQRYSKSLPSRPNFQS